MSMDDDYCVYCDTELPKGSGKDVPKASDDEAWETLAEDHEPDCEWIATRAHRRAS